MDSKWRYLNVFLCFITLLTLAACVAGEPFDCYTLRKVFMGCDCHGLVNDQGQETYNTVVDCSDRNLTQVPSPAMDFNKLIYELRLNDNSITSLGSNILPNLKIRTLDLNGNKISSVDSQAFNSLGPNLIILHLDGDGVSGPPKQAFFPLAELEELTLSNYRVQDLDITANQAYFLALQKLRHLTLDNWGIRSIDYDSFNELRLNDNSITSLGSNILPNLKIRTTTTLLSLTLINQDLDTLPKDALHSVHLANLQKLKISQTPIAEITPWAFSSLDHIQEIDLSKNNINLLEDDCFQGIGDTLTKLDLSGNTISSNANELIGLKGLPNLEELDLSFNENIQSIPDLSQLGSTKPLKLYLNQNKISALSAGALAGFADKLHTLDLSENGIHTIDNDFFNGATQLEVLHISDQSGTTQNPVVLPSSLSQAASSLKQLYLNGQAVDESSLWAVVSQLKMLEVINVRSTELTSIPDRALENLTSIRELDLSYNNLSVLTPKSLFGSRNSLKYLYLGANHISSLPSCLFYQYTSFPITLTLDLNPLICDCNLWWLWARIKNNTIMFTTGQEAKCSDGELLASKQETDFCPGGHVEPQCDEHVTTTTVTTPGSTTPVPLPQIVITVSDIESTSIVINWTISDSTSLKYFKVEVTNAYMESEFRVDKLSPNTRMVKATGLRTNTYQSVCVLAIFNGRQSVLECTNARTT